jgi:plasmid stabilization system protein ParE
LRAIRSYIGWDNPDAAERVARHIEAGGERLAVYPYLGVQRSIGLREFVEPRHRYVLRYGFLPSADKPEAVVILSIWHPKQAR